MDDVGARVLENEGWIAIPSVLGADAARVMAEACRAGLRGSPRQGDKVAGGTRRAVEVLDRVPQAADVFRSPRVTRAVERLLGVLVPVGHVTFRCPEPGFGHQTLHPDDVPNRLAGECRAVTAIVALCDFTPENGATAVVPGSHRRPDLQRLAGKVDLSRHEVLLTGPAGTAFVFSAHLLHRGTRNRSPFPRPALQAQWRLRPPGA